MTFHLSDASSERHAVWRELFYTLQCCQVLVNTRACCRRKKERLLVQLRYQLARNKVSQKQLLLLLVLRAALADATHA
jgi:hypothetical protein